MITKLQSIIVYHTYKNNLNLFNRKDYIFDHHLIPKFYKLIILHIINFRKNN